MLKVRVPAVVGLPLIALALMTAAAHAQLRPVELLARAATAGVKGPILRWCQAEFRPGHESFVVATGSTQASGRYVALDAEAPAVELARFSGIVDLSCYTRAQAEEIGSAIRGSDTVKGHLAPRWNTTVVCGFTEHTLAVCWQYDAANRRFVEVGRWTS